MNAYRVAPADGEDDATLPVEVVTDGYPGGTTIRVAGQEVHAVRALSFAISVDGVAELTIVSAASPFRLDGEARVRLIVDD